MFLFLNKRIYVEQQPQENLGREILKNTYEKFLALPTDMHEHLPTLKDLAMECSTIVEIGVRELIGSTWGLLSGLAENGSLKRSYIGIDLNLPPANLLDFAQKLSAANQIEFAFWQANDMQIDIPQVDFLFIDSLHNYSHLTYELEKFSSKVDIYIAMHDTSEPFGNQDEAPFDDSAYPEWIDRTKRGLWPAVEDFLNRHPEWSLHMRKFNCHGLTVLKRVMRKE